MTELATFPTADQTIDTCGLCCPEPIMLVRRAVRSLGSQQILLVIADDPATTRDIPNFCHFMGHHLLATAVEPGPLYHYLICKG